MSWGTQRRNKLVSIFLSIVFLFAGIAAFLLLYKEPNCFDARKNGGELGIDCGGKCALLCSNETFDLVTLWSRSFEVAPGVHNVLALIQNPNINAGAQKINYSFDLVDEEGITLDKRKGSFSIKPKEVYPLFESALNTGKLSPTRLKFEMQNDFTWERQVERPRDLLIVDEEIDPKETEYTKITAKVQNVTLKTVKNISFIVIIYDENNNAFAASSTLIEELAGSSSKDIVFTWPKNFNSDISKFEIIPLYE